MKKSSNQCCFHILPDLWCLDYQKLHPFAFFADISKKSKTVIAIYVYASESSCFTLLENSVGYYAMSLEDISI